MKGLKKRKASRNEEPSTSEPMYVFVYGTLKKGFGNHRYLEDSEFIGEAKAENISLHARGNSPFPFAKVTKGQTAYGEVYKINTTTLKHLDRLEGTPCLYTRETTTVELLLTGTTLEAYIYVSEKHAKQLPALQFGKWL